MKFSTQALAVVALVATLTKTTTALSFVHRPLSNTLGGHAWATENVFHGRNRIFDAPRSKLQSQSEDGDGYDDEPASAKDSMRAAAEAAKSRMGGGSTYDSVRVVSQGGKPPPPPPPLGPEATFQNTADLYFAQLKADTRTRQRSMIRGDREGHQAVWADPSIKDLEDKLSLNPFLEAERATIETSDDDVMLMEYIKEERQNIFGQNEVDEDTKRKSTGVSYRQMLEEKRKKKSTGAAAVAPPPPAVAAAVAPPPPAAAAVTPPPPPAAAVAPPPPPPPAAAVTPPPPPPAAAVTPPPPPPAAAVTPPPPPPVAATPPPPPPPPAAATPPPPPPPPVAVTPPPPPPPVAVTPPPPPPEVAAPKVVPSSSFDSTSLDASLECVQAVVTAYRVAPPGTIQLESLMNALKSAVRNCDEALGEDVI